MNINYKLSKKNKFKYTNNINNINFIFDFI